MKLIDQYAYTNNIRQLDPAGKAALTGIVIILCLILNQPAAGILSVLWIAILAAGWARLPLNIFLRLLLAEGVFLALTVVGVLVNVSGSALENGVQLGILWFSITPASFQSALILFFRAFGCASALNFLVMTTPLTDFTILAKRLHLPSLLVDLMVLVYRFIFVLLESMERIHRAQDARLGYSSPRQSMNSAALLAVRLLSETYTRSKRLQIALESRGWKGGDFVALSPVFQTDRRLVLFIFLIITSLLSSTLWKMPWN